LSPSARYHFRLAREADLPLLLRWRQMPDVLRWWGRWGSGQAEYRSDLADPNISMWIVEHEGRAFAYAQDYDPHAWDPHPFAHLPPGSRGIDQYIGEADMLDRGHGTAFIRQQCERLFAAGAPAIGTDPHPDNLRARRAYQKAGFNEVSGPMNTRWGRAILTERWR
jgi:aminoglycoside 6'-N-acetyltransferase